MRAVGEKTLEPRFGLRHRIGTRNAGDVEAARMRVFDDGRFYFFGIGQKSRLA
jgi:hypothetical protein